jgi:hypothetical protein
MRLSHTAFALFLAAVLLVELFEEPDRERLREPIRLERFASPPPCRSQR